MECHWHLVNLGFPRWSQYDRGARSHLLLNFQSQYLTESQRLTRKFPMKCPQIQPPRAANISKSSMFFMSTTNAFTANISNHLESNLRLFQSKGLIIEASKTRLWKNLCHLSKPTKNPTFFRGAVFAKKNRATLKRGEHNNCDHGEKQVLLSKPYKTLRIPL